MFKLKSVLDNLDGLDESLKPAYTEKEGKFCLNVEGIDDHVDVKALKSAMQRVKQEKTELQTKLTEAETRYDGLPDDFTVEEYNRLKDSGGGDIDQKLAAQRSRLEEAHRKAIDKVSGERDDAKGKLNKLYTDSALNAAITETGVAAPFAPAVRAMFKDKVKVDFEGDEAIVTIDNLPVADHLKTWAGTEIGKHYVVAPGNGGGGSGGGTGGTGNTSDNPWSKGKENVTRQIQIMQEDPARAESLKKAAGVK